VAVNGGPYGVTASVGGGLDYCVTSNVAFDFETRYLFAREATLNINDGPTLDGNLDAVLFSFGLRIFLANF
jgi:opacity protein-like surface antigen